MNDIHRLIIYTGNFRQHFLIVGHYFLKLQLVACQHRNTFYHYGTCIFTTSAVDGQQQSLCKVSTRTEELNLLADCLIRNAAGDAVIVATAHFAHQIVVLILNRACVYRNLRTECLESFRQIRTPKHSQVRFRRRTEVIKRLQETE